MPKALHNSEEELHHSHILGFEAEKKVCLL